MTRFAYIALLAAALLSGCATLPPGSDFPKTESTAYAHPEETKFGRQFEQAAAEHPGKSGFRLITAGIDGFLARAQMANSAQRTLDIQYFIFRNDETGQLLADALLRAVDRGVRVRILIDDVDTADGDEQLKALDANPHIEIRIFNPFVYRGHDNFWRTLEFAFNKPRLDYRMHNKLFVADNAVALVGGRNLGDEYFQIDPESQLGDDDVFTAGPMVRKLSATFDEFWKCALAIPVEALAGGKPSQEDLDRFRKALEEHRKLLKDDKTDYAVRIASGEPLASLLSGKLPLVWANAQLVYDSPDKRSVEKGEMVGKLMHRAVADTAASVDSELLMISPYFIPGNDGMELFARLRARGVLVRVLTNSLESTKEIAAQSGYMHYRVPLLEEGVELYEIRAQLGNTRGSGETRAISSYGNFGLHGKMFIFDRERVYIGSMNFDQRSESLNTEIGLIIDSPELARQCAARFDALTQPANSYALALRPGAGESQHLIWATLEDGKPVTYDRDPARNEGQRFKVKLLSLLPLDREL